MCLLLLTVVLLVADWTVEIKWLIEDQCVAEAVEYLVLMAVLDTEWRGVDDSKIRIFPSSVVRNDKKYTISGPIDTKVRLEYLFCTGEMFHPKYNR